MTKGQDLSVEEILDSIRGVINNHSTKVNKKDSGEDILELTDLHYDDSDIDAAEDLISAKVAAEAGEALRNLAQHTDKLGSETLKGGSSRTVEELMVDMLRPEISRWLNANLPSIVHQLVEKEIRRLTPKE